MDSSIQKYIRRNNTADEVQIQVAEISWLNTHQSETVWVTVKRIPHSERVSEQTLRAIENEILNDEKYFVRCSVCNNLERVGQFPYLAHIAEKNICHTCATSKYGVTFVH